MAAIGHILSKNVTKLKLFANDSQIGDATGFFFFYDRKWFLVSNWHVFSGRNPKNGQPTHKSCGVPDKCNFHSYRMEDHKFAVKHHACKLFYLDGKSTYFEHPVYGQDVDVAVLPIEPTYAGIAQDLLEKDAHDENFFVDLGDSLFLPGYPRGLTANALFPLWKKASLASSPEFDARPFTPLLVDSACREGMSGSPCFAVANWRYYRKTGEGLKMEVVERPLSFVLLGVYSGRLVARDELDSQIGLIWRRQLIIDTIIGERRARPTLR